MPGFILAAVGGVWIWSDATEYVFRGHLKVVSAVLGGLLIGGWYVFFTGLPWKRRIGLFVGGVLALAVVGIAGKQLLRLEGSIDGGSLPRLVLKGAAAPGEEIGELEISREVEVDAGEESWPEYLGSLRDGVSEGGWEAGLPELVWKREIGLGWSGFVVERGLAVTQEQRGDEELVTAYSMATGEPVWAHADVARFSEHFGGDGPRATPTLAGGRAYAQGATGLINCLDLGTGERIWMADLFEHCEGKNQEWGKSNSPLVFGDSVIVTGASGGPSLLCFGASDGQLKWTAGKEIKSGDTVVSEGVSPSYSSPMLVTLSGVEQIVVVNEQSVSGHGMDDGAMLWSFDWPKKFPKVAQPQRVGDDGLLLTASYGADSFLIRIALDGGSWSVQEEWQSNRMKTKFSSAVVYEGFAYGLDEGRFSCIDLADGKRQWRDGKYGYGQNLLVGGNVLVQAEKGQVVLVEARPDELVETWTLEALEGITWNVPCVAGDYLLVRNGAEAACFRKAGSR